MQSLNPYLIFDGNAAAAFDFYRSVFGGEFSFKMKASDTPPEERKQLDPAEADRLMHICLPLANGQMLMASDLIQSFCAAGIGPVIPGDNQFINIRADNEAEARELFNKLSQDATIQVDMQITFWGDLFGQLTDKFGIQWMINAAVDKKDEPQHG